jgi:hypothetical protein
MVSGSVVEMGVWQFEKCPEDGHNPPVFLYDLL